MVLEKELHLYWETQGQYFGYPSCCIKAFVTGINKSDMDKGYKLKYTGFVPCKTCNDLYTEDELVQQINHKRLETEPFQDSIDRANKYKRMMGYD